MPFATVSKDWRLLIGVEPSSRGGEAATKIETRPFHVQKMAPGRPARGGNAGSRARLVSNGVLPQYGLRARREGRDDPRPGDGEPAEHSGPGLPRRDAGDDQARQRGGAGQL